MKWIDQSCNLGVAEPPPATHDGQAKAEHASAMSYALDVLHRVTVDFTTFPPDLSAMKPSTGGPFINALAGMTLDEWT